MVSAGAASAIVAHVPGSDSNPDEPVEFQASGTALPHALRHCRTRALYGCACSAKRLIR